MFLNCSDEVVRYLGAAIEGALRAPEYAAHGAGHAERLRLGLVDPDCVLVVDCGRAEVHISRRDETDVAGVVAMATDTAVALCRGQLDLERAFAAGEIVVAGAGALLLELIAKHAPLADAYRVVVEEAGRPDLMQRELVGVG